MAVGFLIYPHMLKPQPELIGVKENRNWWFRKNRFRFGCMPGFFRLLQPDFETLVVKPLSLVSWNEMKKKKNHVSVAWRQQHWRLLMPLFWAFHGCWWWQCGHMVVVVCYQVAIVDIFNLDIMKILTNFVVVCWSSSFKSTTDGKKIKKLRMMQTDASWWVGYCW